MAINNIFHPNYTFLSVWNLPVDNHTVEQALLQIADWPLWWPQLVKLSVDTTRSVSIGSEGLMTWRAPLGYELSFRTKVTDYLPGKQLAFSAVGDLIGSGSWRLEELSANMTRVYFTWEVATTKPWMRRSSWLLGPIFILFHHLLMRQGERGLIAWTSKPRTIAAAPR